MDGDVDRSKSEDDDSLIAFRSIVSILFKVMSTCFNLVFLKNVYGTMVAIMLSFKIKLSTLFGTF